MTKGYTEDPEYNNYILGRTQAGRWACRRILEKLSVSWLPELSDFMCGPLEPRCGRWRHRQNKRRNKDQWPET